MSSAAAWHCLRQLEQAPDLALALRVLQSASSCRFSGRTRGIPATRSQWRRAMAPPWASWSRWGGWANTWRSGAGTWWCSPSARTGRSTATRRWRSPPCCWKT